MIQVRPIIQLNKTCYFKQESALFIAFFGCGLFSFCPQISSWCTIGRALLLATLGGTWDSSWGGDFTWGCSLGGVWDGVVVNVATCATSILLRFCGYRGLFISNLCRLIRPHGQFFPVNLCFRCLLLVNSTDIFQDWASPASEPWIQRIYLISFLKRVDLFLLNLKKL